MGRSVRSAQVALLVGLAVCLNGRGAVASLVDLTLTPPMQVVAIGDTVRIDLVASSDTPAPQLFATIDAILNWDIQYLDLLGVDDTYADYPFVSDHFLPDPDGINDNLQDGDALFVALAPGGQEASAPPEGMLVTTFLFQALMETPGTDVGFLDTLGVYGQTRVRRLDLSDVTGDFSPIATVAIIPEPASLLILGFGVVLVARRRRADC